jgi:hypothetical protein
VPFGYKPATLVAQPRTAPRINPSNPIARGLVFAALPVGGLMFDAVTGSYGKDVSFGGDFNTRTIANNGGHSRITSVVARVSAGACLTHWYDYRGRSPWSTVTTDCSIVCIGGIRSVVSGTHSCFGGITDFPASGGGYTVAIDCNSWNGWGGILSEAYSTGVNGYTPNYILGADSAGLGPYKVHHFGYAVRNLGASASDYLFLYDGISGSGTLSAVHLSPNAAYMNPSLFSNNYNGDYCNRGENFIAQFLVWNRAIDVREYAELYANPWQVFDEGLLP